MSYDRALDQICPHIVVDETLYVDSTRQIVRPIQPIASLGSLTIRLNGLLDVPSMGVQIPISVTGTHNGPFTIAKGVNDTLVLKVNQGPPVIVTVPPGTSMSASRVAGFLNFGLVGIGVQFNVVNGLQVQMQSAMTGYASTIWVCPPTTNTSDPSYPGSTIAGTLGVLDTHLYRGVNVCPGWALVLDPNSIPALPYRMIVFDQPLRSSGDFVEISYNTQRQMCRRCGGTGVENDWRYGYTGETGNVVDEALLLQEIEKIMFTVRGTNPFHAWYGTTLTESVGKKLTMGNFVQNLILSDVSSAFSRWQDIKTQQQNIVGQSVTDKEFPFRLLSMNLQQSTQDPTVVYVTLTIQNRSNQPIQIARGLKLPQPLDLLGSTQQQAILLQQLQHPVLVG
jgi:hypothetical protein